MKKPPIDSSQPRLRAPAFLRKAGSLLSLPLLAALAATSAPAAPYTLPDSSNLVLAINTDQLTGTAGAATGNWTTAYPGGTVQITSSGGTPKNDDINGIRWEFNNGVPGDMYRFPGPGETGVYTDPVAWPTASPIVCTGASIVAAIKPLRYADGGNWNSIVDMFYSEFVLAIDNQDGNIGVFVKGTLTWTGVKIPDQQTSIVSVVANSGPGFKVYVNGTLAYTNTTSAAVTSLVPGGSDNANHKHYINIGRNNPDGWPCFNGNIGDCVIYKNALSDTDRAALETDLMAKFHAGASYPAQTVAASTSGAVGGGTISPTGTVTVPYEADQTFTITKNVGYSCEVFVNGATQGDIATYKFNDVTVSTHTIEAKYTLLPSQTVSGNVIAAAGGGATVSFKGSAGALPLFTATTDSSGNYSISVPQGTYYVCASQTGYMISADSTVPVTGDTTGVNFTLTTKQHLNGVARQIPQMENLLFGVDSNDLGAVGTTLAWPVLYKTYGDANMSVINTPMVAKVRGIKYDQNLYVDNDGYRLNATLASAGIPCNGASIVTLVKPVRNAVSNTSDIIAHVFQPCLGLGMKNNNGVIRVYRNNLTYDSLTAIPDGQLTLISLVVQPDGQFTVWTRAWNSGTNSLDPAVVNLSSTVTSTFTSFAINQGGTDDYRKRIGIGHRDGNGTYCYNGYIGDTFVYKTALSDTDRGILESDINTKLNSIATYDITSSVTGIGGTISPLGVTAVGETDNQTYTITPAFGYDVSDVTVTENGVTSSKGAVSSYTFSGVVDVGSITVTFAVKPTRVVTGKVTDGTNPIANATVYLSNAVNASVAPLYTTTTNSLGEYTLNPFDGTWYACASATGFNTSADLTVTVAGSPVVNPDIVLTASGKNIPQMDQLLFSLYGTALTAPTTPWAFEHPKGKTAAVIGTPLVTTVDGLQWEQNRRDSQDGYRIGTYTAAIPVTGLTATAVIQPTRKPGDTGNWRSIIDVMYSRLILGISNDSGQLFIRRNGADAWAPIATALPDGQKTILTVVVQQTGEYQLFANGVRIINDTTTSDMSLLDPLNSTWGATGPGFWSSIDVGRNDPDGWTAYQGNIGAALLWKTALSGAERRAYETNLASTFGITLSHTITASAGAGGTIDPTGSVTVTEGSSSPEFTITANSGFAVDQVLIDGVNDPAAVTAGKYTFPSVMEDHTITAVFVESAPSTFTIAASAGPGGTITPPGPTVTVNAGADQEFTITANAGYLVDDVLVDGVSLGGSVTSPTTIYKFLTVGDNTHTIAATFVTPYDKWARTNANSEAANLDWDKDGMPNGVEYFMGAAAGFTANPPVLTNGLGVRTVTWPYDPTAVVTSWMVQVSDNLTGWTDVLPADPSIDTTSVPGFIIYTMPAGTKQFCRLVVVP